MSFLFKALAGEKGQPQSATETIDKLVDRVLNSSLLEDRRSAVQGLRGLARDWRLDVGTKAMTALINVLATDRMDVEILKLALETLNILCTKQGKDDQDDLGIMFTEIYVKDPSNVTLLLDILAEVDFYVRFDTVQFLTTLLGNSSTHFQDAVLTSPMGISRLIDLLDDRREIIRNEGLLLLISLTKSNAEIQKIIAFENAFERLLSIILDEGATDGGIIVQDCLQLIQNLLHFNVSNQNLFRETSCIKQLGRLLVSKGGSLDHQSGAGDLPLTHERTEWTDQKIANVNAVLDLVRILVGSNNPNTSANQTALGASNIIVPLFQLGMAIHVPMRVRSQALLTVGDTIRGHAANQDTYAKTVITVVTRPEHAGLPSQKQPPGSPKSSLLVTVQTMLGREDFTICAAAAYTFQAYAYRNPDSQLALLSTLIPPPPDNPNAASSEAVVTPGSLLVQALLDLEESRKDSFKGWFASTALMHLLRDNHGAKEMAVSVKFEEGEEHISLLHKVMYTLLYAHREGAHLRVIVGLMSLLAMWLFDCPKAVKEFLGEGSNMQFLVEQVNQATGIDPLVQGLAAYLIGICYEFNDDSEPVFSRANVQSLVVSRIGVDVFQSRLDRLREAKAFGATHMHVVSREQAELLTSGSPPSSRAAGSDVVFDHMFVQFVKATYDGILRSITTVQPRDAASPLRTNGSTLGHGGMSGSRGQNASPNVDAAKHKAAIEALEKTVAGQSAEIHSLRDQVADLLRQLDEARTQAAQQATTMQAVIDEGAAKYTELEKEQEDLLVCLAEQDMELGELKRRLRGHGEVISDDDDEGDE
ncbi:p115 like vesicle tethering protein [Entophlyctis helioformis]|nr:p115 like vesicle tethering protein [Entophlyctis helioformis]